MIVYLAMFFVVFEILSTIFNNYFYNILLFGMSFPLNISVVFFCISFFILDIVTELYDDRIANKLIYGKILCQITFFIFGYIGIYGANLANTQLATVISSTPIMVFNSIIASLIGYKLTTKIMQNLKVKYSGQYLILRYLSSSLPGELAFSLIFSVLSFSMGRSISQLISIFITLSLIKFALSVIFSLLVTPITNLIRLYCPAANTITRFMPFT
jgi:uncharacterized PurR-regulated membrane protein YhhQ (DUF165 family)